MAIPQNGRQTTCTAFEGERLIAAGALCDVALAVKEALRSDGDAPVLVFDDQTGRVVDLDLRGSDDEIAARLRAADGDLSSLTSRSPGRPKLGVVAREVTLLPRHWEWLGSQPGGASVTLRKLVDAARGANVGREQVLKAREAADRFMSAMLGNRPGYEEAARALYSGDEIRFRRLTDTWPADLRDHARRLAVPAFAGLAE